MATSFVSDHDSASASPAVMSSLSTSSPGFARLAVMWPPMYAKNSASPAATSSRV